MQSEKPTLDKQVGWTGKTRGGYWGNYFFVLVLRYLGAWVAYIILIPVAFYFVFFAPQALRASREFQRKAQGKKIFLIEIWRSYKHFYNFGLNLLDRFIVAESGPGKFKFQFEGDTTLKQALTQGKGLVILSGHMGNWEVAAQLLDTFDTPVNVVAFEGEAIHIRKLFSQVFSQRKFSLIEVDGTPQSSLLIANALMRGEIVTMHGDRILKLDDSKNATVGFLGAPALFPVGPYIAAAASGAPLVYAFAIREKAYKYRIVVNPPQYLTWKNRKERRKKIENWAQDYVLQLEVMARQYPYHWFNFYPFWKVPQIVKETDQS